MRECWREKGRLGMLEKREDKFSEERGDGMYMEGLKSIEEEKEGGYRRPRINKYEKGKKVENIRKKGRKYKV